MDHFKKNPFASFCDRVTKVFKTNWRWIKVGYDLMFNWLFVWIFENGYSHNNTKRLLIPTKHEIEKPGEQVWHYYEK